MNKNNSWLIWVVAIVAIVALVLSIVAVNITGNATFGFGAKSSSKSTNQVRQIVPPSPSPIIEVNANSCNADETCEINRLYGDGRVDIWLEHNPNLEQFVIHNNNNITGNEGWFMIEGDGNLNLLNGDADFTLGEDIYGPNSFVIRSVNNPIAFLVWGGLC